MSNEFQNSWEHTSRLNIPAPQRLVTVHCADQCSLLLSTGDHVLHIPSLLDLWARMVVDKFACQLWVLKALLEPEPCMKKKEKN